MYAYVHHDEKGIEDEQTAADDPRPVSENEKSTRQQRKDYFLLLVGRNEAALFISYEHG